MKFFLFSLAAAASLGIWMVSVASSQLALLDHAGEIEAVSATYSNPVNRRLKQDRLDISVLSLAKTTGELKSNFCDIEGFNRACKFKTAGLKVNPSLVLEN